MQAALVSLSSDQVHSKCVAVVTERADFLNWFLTMKTINTTYIMFYCIYHPCSNTHPCGLTHDAGLAQAGDGFSVVPSGLGGRGAGAGDAL